jgi:hypothetical protein
MKTFFHTELFSLLLYAIKVAKKANPPNVLRAGPNHLKKDHARLLRCSHMSRIRDRTPAI